MKQPKPKMYEKYDLLIYKIFSKIYLLVTKFEFPFPTQNLKIHH
uniref:Uncharacterized protein n=1 Tax=Rhizophora mucronata TaxID=61149 RepID=A0A2P2PR31_RHIMU